MRASLWAAAVIALGAPSLARMRRKKSPSQDWLLYRALAAMRKLPAARLTTWRVLADSLLASADIVVRASAQPRNESRRAAETRQIGADLGK